jgi:transposase
VAELESVVQHEPVCNIDETSWRQVGAAKRPWLWTVVTAQVTLFHIAPSRSSRIAKGLLGETHGGVAGTDRCSSYTWLERRQLCWSHLVRDFQKILERGGDSHRIGWHLKCQAEYLLMRWARVRDGTLHYFEFLAEFPAIQTHIRHWLTTGLTVTSSRTSETCRRLLAADPDLWRFFAVPGLEPTNNSAERALRHPVIWRRSSHGTQSDLGSRFVERILTVVETCRQQQRSVFDFLRDALLAYRTGQPAPSLLPIH